LDAKLLHFVFLKEMVQSLHNKEVFRSRITPAMAEGFAGYSVSPKRIGAMLVVSQQLLRQQTGPKLDRISAKRGTASVYFFPVSKVEYIID
jgi:hypothetical protein